MKYMCPTHHKEFKGPNSKGNYWHVIDYDKNEFCNMTQAEVENDSRMNQVAKEHSQIEERVAEDVDKGKIRHGVVCALIQKDGLHIITDDEKEMIEQNVSYIYTGK